METLQYNTNTPSSQDKDGRREVYRRAHWRHQDHGTKGTVIDRDPHHEAKFDARGKKRNDEYSEQYDIYEGMNDYVESTQPTDPVQTEIDEELRQIDHDEDVALLARQRRDKSFDELDEDDLAELMGATVSAEDLSRNALRHAKHHEQRQYLDRDPE